MDASALTSAMEGMNPLSLQTPDWAVLGTGLKPINEESAAMFGGSLPPELAEMTAPYLPALFGDYPDGSGEMAACGVLIAVYLILAAACLFVFIKDWTRGHRFYMLMCLFWFCMSIVAGLGMRMKWSENIMQLEIGIASTTFCQTPMVLLLAFNVYLSTRVMTWRHPETGRSCFQRSYNCGIYCFSIVLIAMSIAGQVVPNLKFLTEADLGTCLRLSRAGASLQCVYSITPILNFLNAFSMKPGKLGKKFFWGEKPDHEDRYPDVIQPYWIEKFSMFYYPEKGSQQVLYTDGRLARAHRVIASAEPPAHGKVNLYNRAPCAGAGNIKTIVIVTVANSIILLIPSILRCIAVFTTGDRGGSHGVPFLNVVFRNWMWFVFYGGFQALVIISWLVFRFDLRFYQPDRPVKRKSGAITPESSEPGEAESATKAEKLNATQHIESV